MFETNFKNDNWSFINNYTGGGWARGLLNIKNKEGDNYFQIGGNGSGQNFTRLYMGKAWNDWNVSINPNNNTVDVNGELKVNNKSVAAKEDVPVKVSQLQNDKGFITKEYITTSAVTSVNGQAGDVVLDVHNIEIEQGSGTSLIELLDLIVQYLHEDMASLNKSINQKADKNHTHNIDEFVHVGTSKPTDGRLWIKV